MNYKTEAIERRDIQIDYMPLSGKDSKKMRLQLLESALAACNRFGRSNRKVISFGWQRGLSVVLEIYHVPKKDADDFGLLAPSNAGDVSPEYAQVLSQRGVASASEGDESTPDLDTTSQDAALPQSHSLLGS
jgi:hypothetical protein